MHSIGRHGSPWTPDTARREALRLLGLIVSGTPIKAAAEPATAPAMTLGDLAERYLTARQPSLRPRTFDEMQRHLRRSAAPLHKLPISGIDRRQIAECLATIEQGSGPVARNRVRASLSGLFTWAIAEGLTEMNPVTGTATADESRGRERVLTSAELKALWSALPATGYGNIIRLLLLTGQRRDEIGALQWSEIDGDCIRLPASRTKNHREHLVPLAPAAVAVLTGVERHGAYCFGFRSGFGDWTKSKARLDAALGASFPGFVIHDLRRTVATGMAELGVLPHVIEAVLNHASGHKASVAGVYNKAQYLTQARDALTLWANHVGVLVSRS
jgi:integrase